MAKVRKRPYYQIETSLFGGDRRWKGYVGAKGCIPINTQQQVSMERLAPGEPPPAPLLKSQPNPTVRAPEQLGTREAEQARQEHPAQQTEQQPKASVKPQAKAREQAKPDILDEEECATLPAFDMLDIPDAMNKMGWPISAKLARRWFSSAKNIYDNDPNSIQPIDDSTVTLEWVLTFPHVKKKYIELLATGVHSEKSIVQLKTRLKPLFERKFQDTVKLDFTTTPHVRDLRQFHLDWQFQRTQISNLDTLSGLTLTDLSGSLANFSIYVAIGNVRVTGDSYYAYDKNNGTKTYCKEVRIKITHVYVYIKDNYSFNDKQTSGKSQYLGHWNRNGVIITTGAIISELMAGNGVSVDLGSSPETKSTLDWNYLLTDPFAKPVDTRRGFFRKFRKQDVYFPIYNSSYAIWRQKHRRGGDFMIYSKPRPVKLDKPIEFFMETICRSPSKM